MEFCKSIAESPAEQERAKKWLHENLNKKIEECPFCTNELCSSFILEPEFQGVYIMNSHRWLKRNGFNKWKQCPIDTTAWLNPLIFSCITCHIREIINYQGSITPEQNLFTLGFDEYYFAELLLAIESEFCLEITSYNHIDEGCQVRDLIQPYIAVLKKLQVANSAQIVNKLFLNYSGLPKQVRISKQVRIKCDKCDGTGKTKCLSCGGQGTKNISFLGGLLKKEIKCPFCKGSGKTVCEKCLGTGKMKVLRLP